VESHHYLIKIKVLLEVLEGEKRKVVASYRELLVVQTGGGSRDLTALSGL
jgi:hypothetical protein